MNAHDEREVASVLDSVLLALVPAILYVAAAHPRRIRSRRWQDFVAPQVCHKTAQLMAAPFSRHRMGTARALYTQHALVRRVILI